MIKINQFEKLKAWQEAHQLVLEIYHLIKTFPKEEKYSLVEQLRRSVTSVPTNIVEGNARKSKKEYIQFLYMAKGSLEETKYHLLLARDLNYINSRKYISLINKCEVIGCLLSGLIKYLRS